MRIGIDARELQGRPTGVGRYLREIVRGWLATPGPHEFLLYAPRDRGLPADLPLAHDALTVRLVDGAAGSLWEQWSLPRALRADGAQVLFAPAYSAPLRAPCPVGLTMHDVSFFAHPEWFSWREGVRRRWLARQCAKRAAVLFTVSEFSAAEVARFLGIPRARIQVVSNGIDHVTRRTHPDVRWLNREPAPHVLSVGSLFNRRHVPTLIQAFAAAFGTMPTARLSIAGENRTFPRLDLPALARAAGVADRTTFLDYASATAIDELLDTADVAVFVSEYEGFGLPMLEALARGVPVVVADTQVSREVCGQAATFVTPGDTAALAAALGGVLHQRPRLAEQLRASAGVLDRYRWGPSSAAILGHLVEVGHR